MAVNLVGTGVRDCPQATNPSACYTEPFVRYNLAHTGPAWVTSYEQQWRVLGVPVGRIEAGKALAAEQWLDPISNGWGRPYVESVAREGYLDRPFGGSYELELELTSDARPERIEAVQVLAQASYWVKQQ
jgi:hypothetical protein